MANSTVCELLLWDTDFFGFRIGRVHEPRLSEQLIRYILEWEKSNLIDCLYFLAEFDDPTTIQLANTHQFQLVDIRVILERGIQRYQEVNSDPTGEAIIRPFQNDDIPILESIAKTSHTDSRFYFDKNFPRDKCDTLYEIWIRRSCEGFADQVLVAELGGVVVGYITCKIVNDITGNIGLVGVGEQARGQGIGKSLVRAALDWFASKNLQSVQLATQGRNISAQRLYQSCGFLTHSVQLWYHRWGKMDQS